MFWSSWGSKSEFAKAAGVEASGRMRDQKIERRCGTKHISKSKCYKHQMFSTTFGHWSVALCGKPNGFCILPKVRKTWRFRDTCKNDGRCGTFQQDLQREFCAAGAIQETSSWNMLVRGLICWEGSILEHQIFKFAKMALRDRCSTSYDLASLSRGRRGTKPSALHSTFHFWTKSRRIAVFLMLSN